MLTRLLAFALSILVVLCGSIGTAQAQGSVLQAGPFTAGHPLMYLNGGAGAQAQAQDAGPAGGGSVGFGLSEILQVNRNVTGTGPFGTHNCLYDNPVQSGSYHYLCLDANGQNTGLIAFGAGGTASPTSLLFLINGIYYDPTGINKLIIGSTTITGGTNGDCLTVAGGVLGNQPCAAGGGLIVGTTPVTGGTNGNCLTISAGVLGNQACGGGGAPEQMPNGGRVTLINGTCIAQTDQVAQSVVYYAPCGVGKYIPIYNGTAMQLYSFLASDTDTTGLTLTLGSNWGANTNFDMFVTLKSSVVTACTLAWTNASTRSTAVVQFKGVFVNAAAISCRDTQLDTFTCAQYQCTLVGGFRTNGSNGQVDLKFGTAATGGGPACICLWNVYNEVQASFAVADITVTWNYTTLAYRVKDGSIGNRVDYLVGLPVQPADITNIGYAENSSANIGFSIGIGIDSQTVNSAPIQVGGTVGTAGLISQLSAFLKGPNANLAVGFHNIYAQESSTATGTTTWLGQNTTNNITVGMFGQLWY